MSLPRNITLKQLRVLHAIADTGSVSGAAKVMNVTPPAISLQLKLLEELAGIPLIQRGSGGMRPTQGGELLIDAASRIETIIDDCNQVLDDMKGTGKGEVHVSVVSTAKYFAPRALAAFKKLHPEIDINIRVGNRTDTVAALESFECDFAIMGRPPAFNVEQQPFGGHPHIMIAPPGHKLAGKKNLPPSRLADETFLLRERGSGTRVLMEEMISEVGDKPVASMEIGSNETIKQAVMAGLGIALISAHTVSFELGDHRLEQLHVKGLPIQRTWQVIRRPEKNLLPAGKALWDFMIAHGQEFLPEV